jgi:hypothetical protein
MGQERVITETYRDKRYEEDYTKLFFYASKVLSGARAQPCLAQIKQAYAAVQEFITATVFSNTYLNLYGKKVKPVMEDVEIILQGDPGNMSVVRKMMDYNVRIVTRPGGQIEIQNGPLLIKQLTECLFLVKQWAYEEGLFLPKPLDRKHGTALLDDVMQQ